MKKLISMIFFFCLVALSCLDLNLPQSAIHNATQNLNLIAPSVASHNPAIIESGIETSATYLFNLKEIPIYNTSFGYQFSKFRFQIGNTFLNHPLYKESNSVISANYELKAFTLGFATRHLLNDIEGYQKGTAFLCDVGMKWKLEKMATTISAKNFLKTEFLQTKLPIFYLWETCYEITNKSKISIGLEKQSDYDFSFKFAAKYDLFKNLSILSGYQYQPDRFGFGMIFYLKNIRIIYSVRTHQYLDLTHYITLGYSL